MEGIRLICFYIKTRHYRHSPESAGKHSITFAKSYAPDIFTSPQRERQPVEQEHFDFIREVLEGFFGAQYVVSAAENSVGEREGNTNKKERKTA
jgi:hypothetical protein